MEVIDSSSLALSLPIRKMWGLFLFLSGWVEAMGSEAETVTLGTCV